MQSETPPEQPSTRPPTLPDLERLIRKIDNTGLTSEFEQQFEDLRRQIENGENVTTQFQAIGNAHRAILDKKRALAMRRGEGLVEQTVYYRGESYIVERFLGRGNRSVKIVIRPLNGGRKLHVNQASVRTEPPSGLGKTEE